MDKTLQEQVAEEIITFDVSYGPRKPRATKAAQAIVALVKARIEGAGLTEEEIEQAKYERAKQEDFQFLRLTEMGEASDMAIAQAQLAKCMKAVGE